MMYYSCFHNCERAVFKGFPQEAFILKCGQHPFVQSSTQQLPSPASQQPICMQYNIVIPCSQSATVHEMAVSLKPLSTEEGSVLIHSSFKSTSLPCKGKKWNMKKWIKWKQFPSFPFPLLKARVSDGRKIQFPAAVSSLTS